MTDCAHWLEPMLDDEKAELQKERLAHRQDVDKAQSLINDIRALINSADAHFAGMPSASRQSYLQELLMQQQQRHMSPYEQRDPYHGGLFSGLFGRGWPF